MTSCYESIIGDGGIRLEILEPKCHTELVRRTWGERLFSLPFKPFTSHKRVPIWTPLLKDNEVLKCGNVYYVNAKTWHEYRAFQWAGTLHTSNSTGAGSW